MMPLLSGRTFLITGATGRLGCEIVPRLEQFGARVLPLVLEGYPEKPKRVSWKGRSQPIPVADEKDLARLPVPDCVISLHWRVDRTLPEAGQLAYEIDCNLNRLDYFWSWLVGKPLQRFVNVSSIKVFSHLNENPICAYTEPRPATPYGMAKLTAEKFFDARFSNTSSPVVHVRLCSVASVGEHPSQLMSRLSVGAFEGSSIRIHTGHIVYLIHIEEAVDLIISAALTANRSRYILAPEGRKAGEVATKFEEISGQRLKADYIDSALEKNRSIFVTDMGDLATDWTRRVALESIISKTIESRVGVGVEGVS